MIELSLPAGTLETALVAFSHGADSVYFGMKDFSARQRAGNFSREDLSKIREYTLRHGGKIYVTINTLVDDEHLPRLYDILQTVSNNDPDGVIVQDLGVVNIIRKDFPSLPLHASTQMAVHTTEGVKALKNLGFSRAVLARELSLSEMKRIRNENLDISLKAFIHGAMCYGVSGLCMASQIVTGRSANMGECAQVCRTYFSREDGDNFFPFSMKDLEAGVVVRNLEKIGIDALKIEGRMKSAEYIAATCDYYRAIIDGEDEREAYKRVLTSFHRSSGKGFFFYQEDQDSPKITTDYTSHLGHLLGRVEVVDEEIVVPAHIDNYDGLMVLRVSDKGLLEGSKFSARVIGRSRDGTTLIEKPKFQIFDGENIYRISLGSVNERIPSTEIPLYKKRKDITLSIRDSKIEAEDKSVDIKVGSAKSDDWKSAIERVFMQSGEASFKVARLNIINRSSVLRPGYPLGELKKARRELYAKIHFKEDEAGEYNTSIIASKAPSLLPNRHLIIGDDGLPWNERGKEIDGYLYVTLSPVSFNESEPYKRILEPLKNCKNVRVGLNNIDELFLFEEYPEFEYFADIYLYMSSREAAELVMRENPKIIGGYLWRERSSFREPWPFTPKIADDVEVPLFISRSCYRHDSLKKSCTHCSKNISFSLNQRDRRYRVIVKNCMTYVMRA